MRSESDPSPESASTASPYAGQDDEIVSDGTESYARGPDDELLATRGTAKRLTLADQHGDVVGGFDPADTTLAALPDSTGYDPFGTGSVLDVVEVELCRLVDPKPDLAHQLRRPVLAAVVKGLVGG